MAPPQKYVVRTQKKQMDKTARRQALSQARYSYKTYQAAQSRTRTHEGNRPLPAPIDSSASLREAAFPWPASSGEAQNSIPEIRRPRNRRSHSGRSSSTFQGSEFWIMLLLFLNLPQVASASNKSQEKQSHVLMISDMTDVTHLNDPISFFQFTQPIDEKCQVFSPTTSTQNPVKQSPTTIQITEKTLATQVAQLSDSILHSYLQTDLLLPYWDYLIPFIHQDLQDLLVHEITSSPRFDPQKLKITPEELMDEAEALTRILCDEAKKFMIQKLTDLIRRDYSHYSLQACQNLCEIYRYASDLEKAPPEIQSRPEFNHTLEIAKMDQQQLVQEVLYPPIFDHYKRHFGRVSLPETPETILQKMTAYLFAQKPKKEQDDLWTAAWKKLQQRGDDVEIVLQVLTQNLLKFFIQKCNDPRFATYTVNDLERIVDVYFRALLTPSTEYLPFPTELGSKESTIIAIAQSHQEDFFSQIAKLVEDNFLSVLEKNSGRIREKLYSLLQKTPSQSVAKNADDIEGQSLHEPSDLTYTPAWIFVLGTLAAVVRCMYDIFHKPLYPIPETLRSHLKKKVESIRKTLPPLNPGTILIPQIPVPEEARQIQALLNLTAPLYEREPFQAWIEAQKTLEAFENIHHALTTHPFLSVLNKIQGYSEIIQKSQKLTQASLRELETFLRNYSDHSQKEFLQTLTQYLRCKTELVETLERLRKTLEQFKEELESLKTLKTEDESLPLEETLNSRYCFASPKTKEEYETLCSKINKIREQIRAHGSMVPPFPEKQSLDLQDVVQYYPIYAKRITPLEALRTELQEAQKNREKLLQAASQEHQTRRLIGLKIIKYFNYLKTASQRVSKPEDTDKIIRDCFLAEERHQKTYRESSTHTDEIRTTLVASEQEMYHFLLALFPQGELPPEEQLLEIIGSHFEDCSQQIQALKATTDQLKKAKIARKIAFEKMQQDHERKLLTEYQGIYDQLTCRLKDLNAELDHYKQDVDQVRTQLDPTVIEKLENYLRGLASRLSDLVPIHPDIVARTFSSQERAQYLTAQKEAIERLPQTLSVLPEHQFFMEMVHPPIPIPFARKEHTIRIPESRSEGSTQQVKKQVLPSCVSFIPTPSKHKAVYLPYAQDLSKLTKRDILASRERWLDALDKSKGSPSSDQEITKLIFCYARLFVELRYFRVLVSSLDEFQNMNPEMDLIEIRKTLNETSNFLMHRTNQLNAKELFDYLTSIVDAISDCYFALKVVIETDQQGQNCYSFFQTMKIALENHKQELIKRNPRLKRHLCRCPSDPQLSDFFPDLETEDQKILRHMQQLLKHYVQITEHRGNKDEIPYWDQFFNDQNNEFKIALLGIQCCIGEQWQELQRKTQNIKVLRTLLPPDILFFFDQCYILRNKIGHEFGDSQKPIDYDTIPEASTLQQYKELNRIRHVQDAFQETLPLLIPALGRHPHQVPQQDKDDAAPSCSSPN